MKKISITSIATAGCHFFGIVLFSLFDYIFNKINPEYSDGAFDDLIAPLLPGTILSLFFTYYLKRKWGTSSHPWLSWLLGTLFFVFFVFLLMLASSVRI